MQKGYETFFITKSHSSGTRMFFMHVYTAVVAPWFNAVLIQVCSAINTQFVIKKFCADCIACVADFTSKTIIPLFMRIFTAKITLIHIILRTRFYINMTLTRFVSSFQDALSKCIKISRFNNIICVSFS